MKYSVVIVAAGKGERLHLGYNKLLYKLDGQTIIERCVSIFEKDDACESIVVVVARQEVEVFKKLNMGRRICFVIGGATRQESVYNGLRQIKSEYVMIHDGARPYLTSELLARLKYTLPTNACMLAVPAIDTIKIVKNGVIETTPNRDTCFLAQTPQCFKTSDILDAHEKARQQEFVGSDDAQLMEHFSSVAVHIVEGSYENRKITVPEDLEL